MTDYKITISTEGEEDIVTFARRREVMILLFSRGLVWITAAVVLLLLVEAVTTRSSWSAVYLLLAIANGWFLRVLAENAAIVSVSMKMLRDYDERMKQ